MATLYNTQTKESVLLLVQHTFGRHQSEASTLLNNPEASRLHAVITWDGDHWFLRDSSTNGTLINSERIISNRKMRLSKDDVINFGGKNCVAWTLLDDSAPQNMLLAITPELPDIILQDIVVLPSEDHPEVLIYMVSAGNWVCESEAGTYALKTGDKVGTKDCIWSFREATVSAETKSECQNFAIKPLSIQPTFNVSQNEEHVSFNIKIDDVEINLGQRNHHYLLLLLAKKRIEDKTLGLRNAEQGWIDISVLSQIAGLSENHINIQIYRIRKQLINKMPQHFELFSVVERRRCEVRFSCDTVTINGGYCPV